MRLRIKQFLAIASLTTLESFRQPITLLLTASSVIFVGLLPIIVTHTLGDAQRLVRDSALALHFVTGLVLGSFTACAALSQDIRKGTATAILSKPVGRALFFVAKFCGIAAALLIFSTLMLIATLLSARTAALDFQPDWWGIGPLLVGGILSFVAAGLHHYFARGPFVSRAFAYLTGAVLVAMVISCLFDAAGNRGPFGIALPWAIVPAGALITMAILVLAGLAVSLATRLEAVPVLTICSVVLMLGLISDYLTAQVAAAHRAWRMLLELLPNWQHFWAVDALARDGIPLAYLVQSGLYAALYLAGILCAGIFAFRQMEVK